MLVLSLAKEERERKEQDRGEIWILRQMLLKIEIWLCIQQYKM